ncbi:hypothetical protein [Candidatus Palauibacter sp.]|uniref:hypothetical protein n=1 Tax=Candidatus Palauibacter sp. TaxID=3101350 RepID=UPI003AF30371
MAVRSPELADSVAELARELVSGELEYWRAEVTRPWRTGRSGPWAEAGRWIGTGLAVGAVVVGVTAALRAERPGG